MNSPLAIPKVRKSRIGGAGSVGILAPPSDVLAFIYTAAEAELFQV